MKGITEPEDCPDLWPYIDPSLATQPVEPIALVESTIGTASTATPKATTYALLNATDRTAFNYIDRKYNIRLKIVTKQQALLRAIWMYTDSTVATENRVYLRNKNTSWEGLVAPTNDAQKIRISARYTALKIYRKRTDILDWLKEWDVTYEDTVLYGISDVEGSKALWDFNSAIQEIGAGYASS